MSRKIIIAGVCTILFLAVIKGLSDLALAERGYHALGGEICLPIFVFGVLVAVKTVKELWARR